MNRIIENNQVIMAGEVVSEFVFSHEVFGEGYQKILDEINIELVA